MSRILDTGDPDALLRSMGFHPPEPSRFVHPCAGECGELLMHANTTCADCDDARRRTRERAAALRSMLGCIPDRYRDARLDAARLRERVADAKAIELATAALERHQVLVLLGPTGAGKSTLAAAVLVAEAEAGASIAWAPALRLATARSEARLGTEPEEVRVATRARAVVLDDLGQEALTSTSAVVDVIHARHDANRSTIVTSGISRRDLGTRYGGGVGRRLLEGACVVEMTSRVTRLRSA